MADASQKDSPLHRDPEFRKVIIFNGPPGSGKDFASEAVRSFISTHGRPEFSPIHMKFSEPLKRAAHALYDVFHSWDFYDTRDGRSLKGMASGDFLGLSPREAYIEMFKKLEELHGPKVLGFIMRKRIVRQNFNNVIVCSDGGRIEDVEAVVELVGQRNVLIIEIFAQGIDFSEDIRYYIGNDAKAKWPKINVVKLPNNIGTKEDKDIFKMLCCGAVKNFLKLVEREDV